MLLYQFVDCLRRQLAEGIYDQIGGVELPARGRAGDCDSDHPGAAGGLDTGGGVFDYRTSGRGDGELPGRRQENLGIWFTASDFCSVDGYGDEVGIGQTLQCDLDVWGGPDEPIPSRNPASLKAPSNSPAPSIWGKSASKTSR